jgi:hypothetical protein
MKTIDIEDLQYETVSDAYSTCKYIERQGISLEEVTLGNAHDIIEELVDDHQLPVTQILNKTSIEGYIIGA